MFIGVSSPFEEGGIYRSTNNGETWNQLLSSFAIKDIAIKDSIIYAVSKTDGIKTSTNNGETWLDYNLNMTTNDCYKMEVLGENIYLGNGNGLYVSTNNGENWNEFNSGLNHLMTRCVKVRDSVVFAGAYGGFYVSTDNGINWEVRNSGLLSHIINCISIKDECIFAGTTNKGIYLSTNDGILWQNISYEFSKTTFYNIAITDSNIYTTSDGLCLQQILRKLTKISNILPDDDVIIVKLMVLT